MTDQHSPEPWRPGYESAFGLQTIIDKDGYQTCVAETGIIGHRDVERIVACVNACRGIPTEELESLPPIAERIAKVLADLAALQKDFDEEMRLEYGYDGDDKE